MEALLAEILENLRLAFEPAVLGARIASFLSGLLVGGSVALVYYLAWRLIARILPAVLARSSADATLRSFVRLFLKYAVLAVACVHVLSALGINTGALLTSLGIAGLTIGFAAQDSLSNVVAGLFIFWDRPFVIGDLVETGDHYGRVDSITLRSTRVVTPDGRMLSIPNAGILSGTVASYTNFPHLRIEIPVQIGVDESIDRARALLLDVVTGDPELLTDPAPAVVLTDTGDYNITIRLQVWVEDERSHGRKRAQIREAAYKRLTEAGVDMPFETLALRPVDVRGIPA